MAKVTNAKPGILILKFPYSSTYGGGEKHTLTLVEALKDKYNFYLLSTCTVLLPEFEKRGWHHKKIWAGVEPVTAKAAALFLIIWPALLIQLLWQLLVYRVRYGVTTLFCLSLTEKVLLTPFAKLLGCKVIWMEHLQIERWLLANPVRPFYVLWSRFATVVTVVEVVREQLVAMGVKRKHTQVIYNSIDVKAFAPSPTPIAELAHRFKVLFIGRLAPEKGIGDLLEAVHQVQTSIPHISLTIVGDGPAKADLVKHVTQLKLTEVVTFAGFQSNIPQWLKEHDVLVLPSVRRETFGIVMVEALATVKPVIATTTGGLSEIVDRYGWLVPPHKPSALSEALFDVYHNYELATYKASSGRIRVLELFQEKRMIQEYDALFR